MIKPNLTKVQYLDLDGPDGNAFIIMGAAQSYMKQMDYEAYEIENVINDMQSSDYIHLLAVFEQELGMVCELRSDNADLIAEIDARRV